MGNKELVEYFKGYISMKARHLYVPKGNCGMSVLIFRGINNGIPRGREPTQEFFGSRERKT